MRSAVTLLLCLALLTAAGCSSHRLAGDDVLPLTDEVQLQYPPSSGHVDLTVAAGPRRYRFPIKEYSLDYSVRQEGDVLHWRLTATGKILGIDHGKRVQASTVNEVLALYRLKESHAQITVDIDTDLMGNPLAGDGEQAAFDPDAELNDAYWQAYYRKVFAMVFVPFSVSRATAGTVVSHGHVMIPVKKSGHFRETSVILSGHKAFEGRDCLVLEYKETSDEFKNRYRQKTTDFIDAALFLDKETKVLRKATGVLQTENITYYLNAVYSEPTHRP